MRFGARPSAVHNRRNGHGRNPEKLLERNLSTNGHKDSTTLSHSSQGEVVIDPFHKNPRSRSFDGFLARPSTVHPLFFSGRRD
jgi:hypothetical protein